MRKVKFIATIGFMVLAVFSFSTCEIIEDIVRDMQPRGIYVGVISVGSPTTSVSGRPQANIKDLVGEADNANLLITTKNVPGIFYVGAGYPVYLDSTTKEEIKTNIIGQYSNIDSDGNPLIVYGVNQVIEKYLIDNEDIFPNDLANVTIVTFTAGIDQGSGMVANKSDAAYGLSVQKKIRGTVSSDGKVTGQKKIRGKPINAYAVATPVDPNEQELQNDVLSYITSGAEGVSNIFKVSNFDGVGTQLAQIASSLTTISTSASVNITISGPSAPATNETDNQNFFVSFDGKGPTDSTKWIKGKVVNTGSRWEIQDLTSASIDLKGTTVAKQTGIRGIDVEFNFPKITGINKDDIMNQYRYYRGSSGGAPSWIAMTGGSAKNAKYGTWFNFLEVSTPAKKRTAVIYLVLDATLGTNDINKVRTAAQSFIEELYTESTR